MKKIIYFVLSVLAIVYIGVLVLNAVGALSLLGNFQNVLQYVIKYGGVVLVFMYASTNFTGNIFKIILFILLLLMAVLFILVQVPAINDFFGSLLGVAK